MVCNILENAPDTENDRPDDGKNDKKDHKASKPGGHILHLHGAGTRKPLSDLHTESQYDHYRKDIDPWNDQHMMLTQKFKERIDHKQYGDAQDTDDNEMQLLIR